MGTPLYMSPEQVNGSKLDLRTDIYSLGVTCYHMLSGHPPFRGETAISVAVQHLKHDPESLEKIRGDLPVLLCRMVHKMMAKPPERRYQSAQALHKDLKRVTADEGEEHPTSEFELQAAETSGVARENFALRFLKGVWYSPDRPFSRQLAVVLILAVLAGGASAGLGWMTRIPNPLAAPLPLAAAVDKKDKAASQYYYALTLKDSIEAWQAVIDDFPAPADRLYVNYAKQQLATLLMAKRRFDEAQQIFDEFAVFGEADPQFRAFGLAGQAILLNLRGDYNQSQRILERLQSPAKPASAEANGGGTGDRARKSPLLFDLLDDKMRQAVTETIHRNVEKLNIKMGQEWDDIFKAHDHAEPGNLPDGSK
jgi:serine/threonine-protein kinase